MAYHSKFRHKDLTAKTAKADSEQILDAINQYIVNIVSKISGINLLPDINNVPFLYSLLFFTRGGVETEIKSVNLISEDSETKKQFHDKFTYLMRGLYFFGRGEEDFIIDKHEINKFKDDLIYILFSNPLQMHDFTYNFNILDTMYPRVAYAIRIFEARFCYTLSESVNTTPDDLALLADVSYSRVMKAIREGKIEASKEDNKWVISKTQAEEWLNSRGIYL